MDNQLNQELRRSGLNWESLNYQPETGDKAQALELAQQIHNAFREGSGRYVLEFLISAFLTKPIVRPGDDAYSQGIREGRADVVRQILANIEFAKQGDQK